MTHIPLRIFAIISILLAASVASAAVVRFQAVLDDGTYVTVDNASGWSQLDVQNLVLAADRSTQHDCVYSYGVKGLFKSGDRIFVNQNYLAWFDYTQGDGVQFPNPPYNNQWTRSGELTGFWSLDPVTRLFKYYRMGPSGCWNYPANEMIAGSASANYGKYWWDHVTYAFEHALGIVLNDGSVDASGKRRSLYMAFNYTQMNTPRSGFQRELDGYQSTIGVHYKASAKMMDANHVTDIYDGNNDNGVQQWINANVEYICRTNDILVFFRFQPTATVTKNNVVVGFSSSYAQDMDGQSNPDVNCDAGGPGEQWPSAAMITKRARYTQSNRVLTQNWTNTSYPADAFVPIELGSPCPPNSEYMNWDTYAKYPAPGDYIRWGYSATIDRSEPRWQLLNVGDPAQGGGTYGNPYNIQLADILVGNERRDGTLGGVVFNLNDQVLQGGTWYQVYVAVSTNF